MPQLRAAMYLRMSREHQRYSLEGQTAANTAYAMAHDYQIVRTYQDAGISGLSLAGRAGLKALLADILGGEPGYDVVLVYDVSRWGRFQDPDQAAHYEFLCRDAGAHIEYTAEAFANDGSLTSTLVKNLKRAMAAEYSRDLSAKVSRAQRGLRDKGYWMGGPCGYGYRRQILAPDGALGPIMEAGERKALQGYRTVLVHGPPHEVATVRRIFRLYAIHGLRPSAIAKLLTREGVAAAAGASWTAYRILSLLKSERYVGALVGHREVTFLRKRTNLPRAQWVRVEGACPPMIGRRLFAITQSNLRKYKSAADDDTLLDELRAVWRQSGRLTADLIENDAAARSLNAYKRRFGGLLGAYARVGYLPDESQVRAAALARQHRPSDRGKLRSPRTEPELVAQLQALLATEGSLSVGLINDSRECANAEVYRAGLGGMRRAYALAGYTPSAAQERAMKRKSGQTIDRETAARIRDGVLSHLGDD